MAIATTRPNQLSGRLRETLNLSTDADSIIIAMKVCQIFLFLEGDDPFLLEGG